ncbi:glycoside hydrolase family 97 protein [Mucilaginibacter hurinus]|uniref:Glycoside hydrolase family 97 protein n=1 Tax=Mucilaginibacter hurinus TaxID=2201324 RepID=A0A367GR52_9SPHI|nr:glycoside hydrolase family 97 protein [Mucilaginibacter hurinus]RCH55193.1 glycoside hydrolase family 97 protein [Mucilaginibacter hurinus]
MKKILITCLLLGVSVPLFSTPIDLLSPDKRIKVSIDLNKKIVYSVTFNGYPLLSNSYLQLNINKGRLGENPKLIKKIFSAVNTTSKPVVPLKNSTVVNHYNLLRMDFKNEFSVEFRAYNNGIAYRFITAKKDSIEVNSEDVHLNFDAAVEASYQETESFSNYEIRYTRGDLKAMRTDRMSPLPVLFDNRKYKVLLSEADLYDYPCLFIKPTGDKAVNATFAKLPLAYAPNGDRNLKVVKEADYIAKTAGTRTFPWRFMVITADDAKLVENQMVYNLSTPNQLQDTRWIKPGQVTWEWWHNAHVYGVDFKSGYNQDTYKYYIDFASKFGIPYIIMDEGWAKTTMNPFEPNPTINLQELIAYGKQKNVKIILWFTWLAVENNFNVFETLKKWGIAGVKIDFMDRSDQWMVNYYTRVAKEAAKHNILVDFHGAFKPAGLEVAYPNVLSYEGVVGMEQNIFSSFATPDNNLYLPFLRNAVGAMDYTPGAMLSAHPKDHRNKIWPNVMSIGTRAHILAMYVVFESGLQMLADNPFNYLREAETTKFITQIPVTWDETRVLEGQAGEYIVTAKRKDDKWFVGAMTNSKSRTLSIKTDFLKKAVKYQITFIKDGINADIQAMDFKRMVMPISAGEVIDIKMVEDGGWVARIEPVK